MVLLTVYYCGVVLEMYLRPLLFAVLFAVFLRSVHATGSHGVNSFVEAALQRNQAVTLAAVAWGAHTLAALPFWPWQLLQAATRGRDLRWPALHAAVALLITYGVLQLGWHVHGIAWLDALHQLVVMYVSLPTTLGWCLVLAVSAWWLRLFWLAQTGILAVALGGPLLLCMYVLAIPGLFPVACIVWLAVLCDGAARLLAPQRVPWSAISSMLVCVVLLDRIGRLGFIVTLLVLFGAIPVLMAFLLPWAWGWVVALGIMPVRQMAPWRHVLGDFYTHAVPSPVKWVLRLIASAELWATRALTRPRGQPTGPIDTAIAIILVASAVFFTVLASVYFPARIIFGSVFFFVFF